MHDSHVGLDPDSAPADGEVHIGKHLFELRKYEVAQAVIVIAAVVLKLQAVA